MNKQYRVLGHFPKSGNLGPDTCTWDSRAINNNNNKKSWKYLTLFSLLGRYVFYDLILKIWTTFLHVHIYIPKALLFCE